MTLGIFAERDPVERWLEHLSEAERPRKRRELLRFGKFLAVSLLERTRLQLAQGGTSEEIEEALKRYYEYLEKRDHLEDTSAARYCRTLRGFFESNDVKLPPPPQWMIKNEPAHGRGWTLEQEHVRAMVDVMADPRDKAIIAFLAQTGQRIGVLEAIKHSEIKPIDHHGLVDVPYPYYSAPTRTNPNGKNVNKGKVHYKFVIGEDTMRLLNDLPTKEGGLWVFDLSRRQVHRIVRDAAEKIGIKDRKKTELGRYMYEMRPRQFRSYWKRQMKNGGVTDRDLLNFLMGHKLPYKGAYDQFPDRDLIEKYKQAEPQLKVL
jgi:integrase/recombinase XerD